MSRKRKNNQFYVGKGGYKTDKGWKPMRAEPMSNIDTYDKRNGKFKSRRRFGKDGHAEKDLDTAHIKVPYDHVHDVSNGFHTDNHRKPTKSERREIDKAKKKRRFWND